MMPRRQFVADLQKAQQDALPLGIHGLQPAEDDGQFEFTFFRGPKSGLPDPVNVTAIIPDLSEYPNSHQYMIFCADDTPPYVGSALQSMRGTERKTVFELVDIVGATLSNLSPDKDGDTPMPDSQDTDYPLEDEDEDDVYGSDHEAFGFGVDQPTVLCSKPTPGAKLKSADRAFRTRIRSDLLAAKNAQFKVGHLGHLLDGFNAFVTLSIRMSKLGISEEAMQAWHLDPSDYLILILQYPNGYKTNEELQSFDSLRLAANIGMRVCASKNYKPTLQEAIKAFTVVKKGEGGSIISSHLPASEDDVEEASLRETFISKPLVALLQARLVPILRHRSAGMGWTGAERFYDTLAAAAATNSNANAVPDSCYEAEVLRAAFPKIVTSDHFAETKGPIFSFPLLAMQYLLRHFVRCTDFCLVCHRQLDTELEAIKPYVCDSNLCLYQYMTLGFGPSIEHEILSQPYVVDLLISFCYNSAWAKKLKEYPDGLALMVPSIDNSPSTNSIPHGEKYADRPTPMDASDSTRRTPSWECGFDRDSSEIIFFNKPEKCPVSKGSWIVLKIGGTLGGAELHCRVSDVIFYPSIMIDQPVILGEPGSYALTDDQTNPHTRLNPRANKTPKSPANEPVTRAATPKYVPASFQKYEQDFQQLDNGGKCVAICKLLDTLPTVKNMQEYLSKRRPADLRHWVRISPAALSLLRWIIASNRACIMQVDGDDGHDDGHDDSGKPAVKVFGKSQERLSGMKDYMQFRFAMGAPDKEQRFVTEVRKTTERLKLDYPTIFAWHGSPLYNWHMIIREGLHYKNADHGRAHGHGVYHAIDAHTSKGYSGMYGGYGGHNSGGERSPSQWPNSVLRITSAVALNEIINAPSEFSSSQPYYVVQHLDWIQTRYLFVQCAPALKSIKIGSDKTPNCPHPQDPKRTPKGVSGSVVIPASAIKSGRTPKRDNTPPSDPSPLKKLKNDASHFYDVISVDGDDDRYSVATDPEDLDILFDDEPEPEPTKVDTPNGSQTLPMMEKPQGDVNNFVPGQLDFSTLPLMPEPNYATSGTTKRLLKELQNLHRVQEASNLAELGWFIDTAKIENPYQWIAELHSFHTIDKKLQLVSDMKKRKIKSIVLEIRFHKDFPFSPPYVRVIRPRFLSFAQGGGGHIVMGGAMCMELLTNTGWSSVSSMESVLMQIRLAIASDPPAKLDMRAPGDYGTGEGADGYIRACQSHGWVVPPGFREMAYGMGGEETNTQNRY